MVAEDPETGISIRFVKQWDVKADQRISPFDVDMQIDPAEWAAHTIISALSTLETELAKVSDLERCWTLRRIMGSVTKDTERVHGLIVNKIEMMTRADGR